MMKLALLGIALTALACTAKKDDTEGAASNEGAASPAAATTKGAATTALGGGSITGTVKFTGTAPANPTIDMGEEPECQKKYSSAPTDPQVVVSDGKLANVFVFVKSGLPAGEKFPVPTAPAVIDQQGCLYHPRSFGVMTGQKLEIKNSDPVLHNIKAVPKKNRGFNISQPREGMTTTRTFAKEEVMVPIQCNVHGWMHANVGVVDHPFFATSGPDGSFTIKGLPPGTYEVEAWHEKLGSHTATVTVPATGAGTADFTFTPTAS
jgi:plastocyanin